jgi:toxin YhaV
MLVVNGWQLFAHPALLDQLGKLEKGVEHVKTKTPLDWQESPKTRLLETIRTLMFEIVPQDPTRTTYRQGDTLGDAYKHWFRVKFGNGRFRLFFRYSLDAKIIIYAWVNDETTMRTYGSKTDAYAVFRKMLNNGNPPDTWG